jgi:hypothetical protein
MKLEFLTNATMAVDVMRIIKESKDKKIMSGEEQNDK